jgi:hypothetical protein
MRIRNHIRSNVVGYLALFFAFSGVAYATHPGGANTISSGDIINEEVRSPDIGPGEVFSTDIATAGVQSSDIGTDQVKAADIDNGAVRTAEIGTSAVTSVDIDDSAITAADLADGSVASGEVLDDTVVGGGLAAADLQANSVGTSEIQTDGVQASEVANDSIDSGEIADFGLSNQDIGVLFAEVNANATLANSSGGVTVTRVGAVGAGNYEVDFGRNITACTSVTMLGGATTNVAGGEVSSVDRSTNVEALFVDTNTSAGAAADLLFHAVVVC